MDPDKRQRLRKNHILLKENLRIGPVLDRLYAKSVLSDNDSDAIRTKFTTADQIQEFLDYLRRTGNKGYAVFCEALEELQPDLLKVLEDTTIDKDTLGEVSDSNIFFDPSDDFELKGLIDQLSIDKKITTEQLERMKNLVIDEVGCPEEIIEKKDTSPKFLRHLMKTRLLTRYNLAFLQALLWRVGNKVLCQEVANFARQISQHPIHFYTPKETAENGFSFSKFHIKGDLEHFKGITIADICQRVARYLGVPQSYVIPAGVEPSESFILTIMLHKEALVLLKSVENFTWLTDLGVDYIMYEETKTVIRAEQYINQEATTEIHLLEKELKKKLQTEQHLKQCLYDEQVSNEILKSLQTEQEDKLKRSEETVQKLNIWYTRVFAAVLLSLHFIAELIKERRGLTVTTFLVEEARLRYFAALEKAKRWSSNHTSLLELVEATTDMMKCTELQNINTISIAAHIAMVSLQENFADAVTTRMTERRLGIDSQNKPSMDEVRQATISLEVITGTKGLEPVLQEIVCSLANKLNDEERQIVCRAYSVPDNLQTPNLRHRIFDYIIISELEKMGKINGTNDDIGKIMKAALKEIKRKDLWEEFQAGNNHRLQMQKEQLESQTRKQTDINDRLDKIEKMMQTMVGQNVMTSMGMQGFGQNGTQSATAGIPDQFRDFLKGLGTPLFPSPFCQKQS